MENNREEREPPLKRVISFSQRSKGDGKTSSQNINKKKGAGKIPSGRQGVTMKKDKGVAIQKPTGLSLGLGKADRFQLSGGEKKNHLGADHPCVTNALTMHKPTDPRIGSGPIANAFITGT